jgi:hypothetical protein
MRVKGYQMKTKCLAVGIILLFVGVTIAPTINQSVVKASQDDDLVEVTTQACGIKGYRNTTVKLTREQYRNLEEYLVEFRARLNQTSTREEAVPIFKDAVVELDKYGLLPKEMSAERAQKFVTSGYQNLFSSQHFKKHLNKNPFPSTSIDNKLCLVSGNVDNSFFLGPMFLISILFNIVIFLPIFFLTDIAGYLGFTNLEDKLDNLFIYFFMVLSLPFDILGLGTFGRVQFNGEEVPPTYTPSHGWINSFGVLGTHSIEGSFYGSIGRTIPGDYIGIRGFSGLIIGPKNKIETKFFIGSAFRIGFAQLPEKDTI